MLKQQEIHLRQAGEAAGTKQEFETPQAELAWLKEHRQNLKGFVRVLEIIDEAQAAPVPFIEICQGTGWLPDEWLKAHRPGCRACIGALLCWFFGNAGDQDHFFSDCGSDNFGWEYEHGFALLRRHLGMTAHGVERELWKLIGGFVGGRGHWWHNTASSAVHDGCDWPVPHLDVFRKFAAAHPDK